MQRSVVSFVGALFILVSVFVSSGALGYPNYVSYGYGSCMSCHYNPYGNGPLTDYGRSVSATEIAGRLFVTKSTSEEALADRSGFMGEPSTKWLRPSLNYRGLFLQSDIGGDNEDARFINMDLSVNLVAKFLKNDRLILVGNIAFAPKPLAYDGDEKIENYRTREHYFGYRLSKELGIYAGLMEKVFGLRIADHIAFSRSVTNLNQNDQTHGVLVHYLTNAFEIGVQPFIGNLVQDDKLRQKGVTTQMELQVGKFTRLGGSFLHSRSDFNKMTMFSGHGRFGIPKGHSVLVEAGNVSKKQVKGDDVHNYQYLFSQGHYRAFRGFWVLATGEHLNTKNPDDSKSSQSRFGPGVQYFPIQRVEVRADLMATSMSGVDKLRYDYMGQMHLWF